MTGGKWPSLLNCYCTVNTWVYTVGEEELDFIQTYKEVSPQNTSAYVSANQGYVKFTFKISLIV